MRKFFSSKGQIRLLKHALKKSEQDPSLYDSEELHKLKLALRELREKAEEERQFQNGGFGYEEKKTTLRWTMTQDKKKLRRGKRIGSLLYLVVKTIQYLT